MTEVFTNLRTKKLTILQDRNLVALKNNSYKEIYEYQRHDYDICKEYNFSCYWIPTPHCMIVVFLIVLVCRVALALKYYRLFFHCCKQKLIEIISSLHNKQSHHRIKQRLEI